MPEKISYGEFEQAFLPNFVIGADCATKRRLSEFYCFPISKIRLFGLELAPRSAI
jgi:hypothetical protein